eukprot:TRINITY_DN3172_c0_g1_i1.p1 TRINITY_DN3172_c0_g1~~TRINITY_DN3172_c0_g1_i1.p1  ORF type:complete len:216 (+),score=52.93 TRINITY_DN3172_c0_g1_i1:87-734(+)
MTNAAAASLFSAARWLQIAATIALVCCLVIGAQAAAPHKINVTWVNRCFGPIDLFWVHHDGRQEMHMFSLPEGHRNHLMTSAGNAFVAKFSYDNKGNFGENIIETWKIQDLPHSPGQQEIKFCRNDINVTFINGCGGPVDLFWLHNDEQHEIYQYSLPKGHQNHMLTSPNNTFRIKFSDMNRGKFGKDVLEEWIIEHLPHSPHRQEVKFCIHPEL